VPLRTIAALAPHGLDLANAHATGTLVVRRRVAAEGQVAVADPARKDAVGWVADRCGPPSGGAVSDVPAARHDKTVRRETYELNATGKLDGVIVDHRAVSGGPMPLSLAVTPASRSLPRR